MDPLFILGIINAAELTILAVILFIELNSDKSK